ncbi:MAG: hypothetical protein V4655_01525, partial [Bdellovibrionota bacterium]
MTDTKQTSSSDEATQDDPSTSAVNTSEESSLELTGKIFPADSDVTLAAEIVVSDDDDENVSAKPIVEDVIVAVETFEELNLAAPLMAAITKLGWTKPTLIQAMGLPLTTKGQDLAGFSQTGTGKTGVFLITIAHQ